MDDAAALLEDLGDGGGRLLRGGRFFDRSFFNGRIVDHLFRGCFFRGCFLRRFLLRHAILFRLFLFGLLGGLFFLDGFLFFRFGGLLLSLGRGRRP